MRVLITGVAGSGGSYLADWIIDTSPEILVHGISRWHSTTNKSNVNPMVIMHECDMTDLGSVIRTIQDIQPEWIFHLASYANVRASFDTPISVINNNVMCTLNLLEALRILKMLDTRLQICSTSEVYGIVDKENVPIDEMCLTNPVNPYAVSKLVQDNLGYVYHKSYGLDVVRTRAFTYVNPRRADLFATSFATQIVKMENEELSVLCHGNLDSIRTIVDVRDMCNAYWLALEHGEAGEIYNIGGTTVISVGEFLNKLISMSTLDVIDLNLDPQLLRPVDVTLQIPNVDKFIAKTGWKPEYTFDETVQFLLDELRKKYVRKH